MVQMDIAQGVDHLASEGRTHDAYQLLSTQAAAGDAGALFTLGLWRLSGQNVPRNLAASRDFFRRAATAGHDDAARIYTAFVAGGTGGPANWADALRLMSARAETDASAARQLDIISDMALTSEGEPVALPGPKQLSASPKATLFPKLFSPAECAFLIEVAEPIMQPSVIVHPQTGQPMRNPVRTSDAAAFPLADEDPALHALNRRIAAASGTRVKQGEPLQVLRYRPGQEYRPHSDVLPGERNQRVLTMLVYLNDGYRGGETFFMANGLKVRGEIGDALLFRNVREDGRPDENAAHAGLPVTSGVKFISSRWIRAAPLQLESAAV